jgi:tetratricopeptide (TPR) repeat protein
MLSFAKMMRANLSKIIQVLPLLLILGCLKTAPDLFWRDAEEFGKGNQCLERGDYDCALENYDFVIKTDPFYGNALNNRGVVYYLRGDYAGAEKDFVSAVEADPDHAPAWNNLGWAEQERGDYRAALDSHSRAIQLNARFGEAYYGRGTAYYKLGNFKAAAKDFDTARVLAAVEEGAGAVRLVYYAQGNASQELQDFQDDRDAAGLIEPFPRPLLMNRSGKTLGDYDYGYDLALVIIPAGPGSGEMAEKARQAAGSR